MESLVQFCLKEISYDGEHGSSIARLRHFVNQHYEVSAQSEPVVETIASLWPHLCRQKSVIVGIAPDVDGVVHEVPIALPQKWRAAVAKTAPKERSEPVPVPEITAVPPHESPEETDAEGSGSAESRQSPSVIPPTLQVVQNLPNFTLNQLVEQFGDRLRIAVDPNTVCLTLTGEVDRPGKINARMYTVLQLIARSRERGLTAEEVTTKTGYDLKTCYHFIRQLVSMDLILKVRKNNITRVDFCIHKLFASLIPSAWTIRVAFKDTEEKPTLEKKEEEPAEVAVRKIRGRIVSTLAGSPEQFLSFDALLATLGPDLPRDTFLGYLNTMEHDGLVQQLFTGERKGVQLMEGAVAAQDAADREASAAEAKAGNEGQTLRGRPRRSAAGKQASFAEQSESGIDRLSAEAEKLSIRIPATKRARPEDTTPEQPDPTPNGGSGTGTGEPPPKRKRGRPRKEETLAALEAARNARKDARAQSPTWAAAKPVPPKARRQLQRPSIPSPPWIPRRIPTPPWMGDRGVKIAEHKYTPMSLASRDMMSQTNLAAQMINDLETKHNGLAAGGRVLAASDLRTLLPGFHLNSTVLDTLNDMMILTTPTIPNVHIAPSVLYGRIAEVLETNSTELAQWESVLRSHESIDIFGLHRFVIPIQLPGHWVCGCVDFKECTISVYDSLPESQDKIHMGTIRAISTWLDQEAKSRALAVPDWKVWKADPSPKGTAKQQKEVDSGFYTWLFARSLVMMQEPDMAMRLDIDSERIWLVIDGIQSLPWVPLSASSGSTPTPTPELEEQADQSQTPSVPTPPVAIQV